MSSPSPTSKHPSQTKSTSSAKPSNLPLLIQLSSKAPITIDGDENFDRNGDCDSEDRVVAGFVDNDGFIGNK